MADLDEFREEVKKEVEDRIEERSENNPPDAAPADSDELSPSGMMSRGWNMEDYNSFFGSCREDGYDASACGSMWTAAKEAGVAGQSDPEPVEPAEPATVGGADAENAESGGGVNDLLVIKDGAESSDLAAQYLADPIMDGEIDVLPVESEPAQELLAVLDDVPAVPAHLELEGDEVRVGDLRALFQEAAGGA